MVYRRPLNKEDYIITSQQERDRLFRRNVEHLLREDPSGSLARLYIEDAQMPYTLTGDEDDG